jgi:D-serine deaminase-like pyridoxal phosphate-dependent protein
MPALPPPEPGDPVEAVDTPALVLDLDAAERNIATMAGYASRHGLLLRPHAKSHKSPELARLQLAAGAVGVCVQKASEALALADGGVEDLFVSNEVIAPAKLAALARLAGRVRLALAVDSPLGVQRLAAAVRDAGTTVRVLVEVDVGQGRCGLAPEQAGVLAAAVLAAAPAGLTFGGLHAYHGGAQHLRAPAERAAAIHDSARRVTVALESLQRNGIRCPLVTGAGTGTFIHETGTGVWGELQPGSYVFLDRDYADNEPAPGAPRFEHALFVKSRVISEHGTHAVVDAGHKAHAIDSGMPGVWGRDLEFGNGGDEHGILTRRGAEPLPALGDTVWLVPGHCDPTVNLHDSYVVVRGGLEHGKVHALWPVAARGALR